MDRVNRILRDQRFLEYLLKNKDAEMNRIFCCHDFEHLLATARLSWILILESGNPYISREITYAAALLHDIGRWCEYESSRDHALCSAELAAPILREAGFSESESNFISRAIRQHRSKINDLEPEHRSPLAEALCQADRYSRICFACPSSEECYKVAEQPHERGLQY